MSTREISRIIPDFSRTVIADENRVFCLGGQDEYTSDSLSNVIEIDLEQNLRVKDKVNMF